MQADGVAVDPTNAAVARDVEFQVDGGTPSSSGIAGRAGFGERSGMIGRDCTLNMSAGLANENATAIIGDRTGAHGGNRAVYGNATGGIAFIGAGLLLFGDDACIVIAEDCMLAHEITMRTNDDHAMIDMETGRQLDPTANILLEPPVWVCSGTIILRGARIGLGSVVGARSVVGGTYPRFALVAGAPARAVRTGVGWDRPQPARENQHHILRALERSVPPAW